MENKKTDSIPNYSDTEQLPKVTTTKQKLIIAGIVLLFLLLCGLGIYMYGKSQREAGAKEVTDKIELNKQVTETTELQAVKKELRDTIKAKAKIDSTNTVLIAQITALDTKNKALITSNNNRVNSETPEIRKKELQNITKDTVKSIETIENSTFIASLLSDCQSENNLLQQQLTDCNSIKEVQNKVIVAGDTLIKTEKDVENAESKKPKHPILHAIAKPFIYIGSSIEGVAAAIGTYVVVKPLVKP